MNDLHPIQVRVILHLSKNIRAKFSELNVENISNDWFSYHLRQLTKKNLITKKIDQYQLSDIGKKIILKIDPEKLAKNESQRISVLLIIEKTNKYLVQLRSVDPFRGYWEFPTKRINYGDNPLETAKKLLFSETGLLGSFQFIGINHKVETQNNQLFDDKYYLVYLVTKTSGTFKKRFDEGNNHWLSLDSFKRKKKVHFDLHDSLKLLNRGELITDIVGDIKGY